MAGLADPRPARRQRTHVRAAEALEELYADRLDDHSALLAYHFEEAALLIQSTFRGHQSRAGHAAALRWVFDFEAEAVEELLGSGESDPDSLENSLEK